MPFGVGSVGLGVEPCPVGLGCGFVMNVGFVSVGLFCGLRGGVGAPARWGTGGALTPVVGGTGSGSGVVGMSGRAALSFVSRFDDE